MKIENRSYAVDFDVANGSIVGITDKKSGIALIAEPRLAGSFRLLVPLPHVAGHYIAGEDQALGSWAVVAPDDSESVSDEVRLVLSWEAPLVSKEGSYDIPVQMSITLAKDDIRFGLSLANNTDCKIAEVIAPVLGGTKGIGDRINTKVMVPYADSGSVLTMFESFTGNASELGTPEPEYFFSYPGQLSMQWIDFYNASVGRGMYFACHDEVPRLKTILARLYPGIGHGRKDTWPSEDEIDADTPVGIVIAWVFFPYVSPGARFATPPVVAHFHDGDWHGAAQRYRTWFEEKFVPVTQGTWMRDQPAFMDTIFMLPEGNINFTYKDIPAWARSAKERGIMSVLISGWDKGGHDKDYPYYEPDPRLGTWEGLKAALDAIHEMGMRAFFFVNLQPLDRTSDTLADFGKYIATDQFGNYGCYGFGMGSVGAKMNMTSPKLVDIDPIFPDYRKFLVDKFKKLVEIGADGLHIDKLSWFHGLDLNPEVAKTGVSPDQTNATGQLLFCKELLEECQKINPEFCISIEGPFDQMIRYTQHVWLWHSPWNPNHLPVMKYAFPQWKPCYAISQPFDYVVVNDALRYGYQFFVGPMMYNDSMALPLMRKLGLYIQEAIRIREALKETIYHGEFLDTRGATVIKESADIYFNTHRNPSTGRIACVLTNAGATPQKVKVSFDTATENVAIYEPFKEVRHEASPPTLEIPGGRFVVVLPL